MRIYVASSWRNDLQPRVVEALRGAGHEVYDFKNPAPDNHGFHWSEIGKEWKDWTPEEYRRALASPIAEEGYNRDFDAMKGADACVLVLPCGRSAHIEAGWFWGQGKPLLILMASPQEPELMYRDAQICVSLDEVILGLLRIDPAAEADLLRRERIFSAMKGALQDGDHDGHEDGSPSAVNLSYEAAEAFGLDRDADFAWLHDLATEALSWWEGQQHEKARRWMQAAMKEDFGPGGEGVYAGYSEVDRTTLAEDCAAELGLALDDDAATIPPWVFDVAHEVAARWEDDREGEE